MTRLTRLFILCLVSLCWGTSVRADLVEGDNIGFVTVAPTADPAATALTNSDNRARSGKYTAPADGTVTAIGWYCNNATEDVNFETGLYTDNDGGATSLADSRIAGSVATAKGTGAGWKEAAVDAVITSGTIYWGAFQLDNTATTTETDGATGGGRRGSTATGVTTLPATWTDAGASDNRIAIYILYTPDAPAATRRIFNSTQLKRLLLSYTKLVGLFLGGR